MKWPITLEHNTDHNYHPRPFVGSGIVNGHEILGKKVHIGYKAGIGGRFRRRGYMSNKLLMRGYGRGGTSECAAMGYAFDERFEEFVFVLKCLLP